MSAVEVARAEVTNTAPPVVATSSTNGGMVGTIAAGPRATTAIRV